MAGRCLGFPVLNLTRAGGVRMMEISQYTLPHVRDCLLQRMRHQESFRVAPHARSGGATPPSACSNASSTTTNTSSIDSLWSTDLSVAELGECDSAPAGLRFDYWVGAHVCIPFTVMGSLSTNSPCREAHSLALLLHTPGLDGGFVVSLDELSRARGRIVPAATPPSHGGHAAAAERHTPRSLGRTSRDDVDEEEGTDTSSARLLGWLCVMEALRSISSPADSAVNPTCTAAEPWRCGGDVSVLDRIFRTARRRHWGVCGMEKLLQRAEAEAEHVPTLQLRFPYHCGGAQAYKRYLDIRPELCCALYGDFAAHGTRVLSRYGTVVSVGVCSEYESSLGEANGSGNHSHEDQPHPTHPGCTNTHGRVNAMSRKLGGACKEMTRQAHRSCDSGDDRARRAGVSGLTSSAGPALSLMWHVCGAPAACAAPLMHGSASLVVGKVALEYNGPTAACALLERDEPRRYMNATEEALVSTAGASRATAPRVVSLDRSLWLCQGLFGVRPGQPYADGYPLASRRTGGGESGAVFVVAGVGYDDTTREFDLYIRDQGTGEVVLADDVS